MASPLLKKAQMFHLPAFSMEEPATQQHIDEACYQMYCEWRFNPRFLLMTKLAHDLLLLEVLEPMKQQGQVPEQVDVTRLHMLLNKTTGSMMEVFVSEFLETSEKPLVIFGGYDL